MNAMLIAAMQHVRKTLCEPKNDLLPHVDTLRVLDSAKDSHMYTFKTTVSNARLLFTSVLAIVPDDNIPTKPEAKNEDKKHITCRQGARCKRKNCPYGHPLTEWQSNAQQGDKGGGKGDKGGGKGDEKGKGKGGNIRVAGHCRTHLKGSECKDKECKWRHDNDMKGATKDIICQNFKKDGKCDWGEKCCFKHDKAVSQAQTIDLTSMSNEQRTSLAQQLFKEMGLKDAKSLAQRTVSETGYNIFYTESQTIVITHGTIWLIDSGASIITIGDSNDPDLLLKLNTTVNIDTSNGKVTAHAAIIRTPFGPAKGAYYPGAHKILPMEFVAQHALVYWNKGTFMAVGTDGARFDTFVTHETPKLRDKRSNHLYTLEDLITYPNLSEPIRT